jgi:hypothetical protein
MRIFMIALFMSLYPLSWVNGAETYHHDEKRSLSFLTRCVNTFDQARNQWTHSPLGQISAYTQSLWDTAHKNPFMEIGVGVLAVAGAELFLDKSFLSTIVLGLGSTDIICGVGGIVKPIIAPPFHLLIKKFDDTFGKISRKKVIKKTPHSEKITIHTAKKENFSRKFITYGTYGLNIAASYLVFQEEGNMTYVAYRKGINPFGLSVPHGTCPDDAHLCIPLLHSVTCAISSASGLYNMMEMLEYYRTGIVHKKSMPLFRAFNAIVWGMVLRNAKILSGIFDFIYTPYIQKDLEKSLMTILLKKMSEQEKQEEFYKMAGQFKAEFEKFSERPIETIEGIAHWFVVESMGRIFKQGGRYIDEYLRKKGVQDVLNTTFDAPPKQGERRALRVEEKEEGLFEDPQWMDETQNTSRQVKGEEEILKKIKIKTKKTPRSHHSQEITLPQGDVIPLNEDVSETLEDICTLFRTQSSLSMSDLNPSITKICGLKNLDYSPHGSKNRVSLGQYTFEPPHGNGNLEGYRKTRALKALVMALMHNESSESIQAYLNEHNKKQKEFSLPGFIEAALLQRD